MSRSLQDLWAPLTDAIKVFDTHGSVQQLCAQKVWETLLTFFPLDHKHMQTVLLAREIDRMIRWDGDSKGAVNRHFASVTDLHRTMGYIGNLSIEDVLKSVLMATLKASTNRSLRDAYHKVLDDLDDDKDLSFALIKDACARQFRRHPDERPFPRDTPRATPRTSPVKTEKYNKYKHQGGNKLATFLCNTLEKHGEQPGEVLRPAGLAGAEWNESASGTTLFRAAQKHFPGSVPSDTDDDDDTDYDAAAAYESDDCT